MLKRKHFPTPLIQEGEKPLLPIIQISKPARLRNLRLLFSFWGLIFRITWLTITRRATEARKGKMVREMLESFGGLWIKAGQLVSMRSDLLEREFRDELSKLQDRAPGFPFESAKPMIEAAIGNEMDQVFSIFNETPIAAASLAQVYKAKLRTEEKWVAVKVQKPFANEYLKQDMKFINTLHFITKSLGLQAHSPMDEMVWELRQMMMEELDFRYEASHMRRMKKSLKPHKKIYVPKVYKTYCDRQVIVMEFI
ncbi:MAG: AarF/ABC1/UbiB kinase family protein, partial [Bacteroidetes bacterium]|nr:AarF/ABC1/UbiB kinase family protein [Bacteroidota bacterium]